MHTIPISFCSGTAYHLTDEAGKEEILRDISDRLRVRTMTHDARLYRSDSGQDTSGTYVSHLQSNGNAYLLFLTRIGYSETSLYVDRKVRRGHSLPRVILDHLMFSRDLYDGTVISGEMVRTKDGEWMFLADDLFAVRGRPLFRVGYRDRYAALIRVLECCVTDGSHSHRIAAKRVFPATDEGHAEMQRHSETVPYGNTGCVYKSLSPGGKNWFVRREGCLPPLQSSPGDTRVMTVKSTVSPDVYEVYDEGKFAGGLGVQQMDASLELAREFGQEAGKTRQWACRWSPEFGKWIALPGGGAST